MTALVLPGGFAFVAADVLANGGPADAAAGHFAAVEATEAALWSRQVLTDARLRAVAIVPPATGTGPERFQSVHRTAERVAGDLGIGAVEVAVCWADPATLRHAVRHAAAFAVAAVTTSELTILVTDATAPADVLYAALSRWPTGNDTVLFLASGASGNPVDPAALANAVADLHTEFAS